ncbi:MAG: ABC transporter ATP-binding protein [Eubacteriales bacterium]|nr:ABC transporter ATP-binding protein [Eubacteriales bacterium]
MSLTVSNLSFSYGTAPVLQNVSFSLGEGQLYALLGANGAGKTTLFRCILGLNEKYEGSIIVDGSEVRSLTPRQLSHRIAYIPQIHYPAFQYSVLEMVLMGTTHRLSAVASPGKWENNDALQALQTLGIEHLAHRDYGKLSGGEQQMVLIARALVQQTKLLLMDEPTASLDYGNQLRVLYAVRRLARDGYTILLSTHNPQHALSYADRVIALAGGTLAADGPTQEVLSPALLKTLYGVEAVFSSDGRYILPQEVL